MPFLIRPSSSSHSYYLLFITPSEPSCQANAEGNHIDPRYGGLQIKRDEGYPAHVFFLLLRRHKEADDESRSDESGSL